MRVTEFLDPRCIFLGMDARTKEEALEAIGRRLEEVRAVDDAGEFIALVRRRESQGCTAIGKGVAIPHARTRSLSRILVAMARLKSGVDFGAEDGEPVRLIFLIGTPQDMANEYLKVLGRLSKLIKTNGLPQKLMKARTAEDVLGILGDED